MIDTLDTAKHFLLPENIPYGFALSQLVDNVLDCVDCSSVQNQCGWEGFDSDSPQALSWFCGSKKIPFPDAYEWKFSVELDSGRPFGRQRAIVTYCSVNTDFDYGEQVFVDQSAFVLPLKALLHLLKMPRETWPEMLGFFDELDDESGTLVFSKDNMITA